MADKFTIEVSASEKRLLESLREEELRGRAKTALAAEFDIDSIKPGMTPQEVERAMAAIGRARAARERG